MFFVPSVVKTTWRIKDVSGINPETLLSEAVFSDESSDYLRSGLHSGSNNSEAKIRLPKNLDASVFLAPSGGLPAVLMRKERQTNYFDIYSAAIPSLKAKSYYFIIQTGGKSYYYNKGGVRSERAPEYDFRTAAFDVPAWAKGAVMYQIFADRFCNGDPSNDVVNNEYVYLGQAAKRKDWHDPVENVDIANFYGGDIAGIIQKLPYLKDLGVEVLYLNPVFVSPSTHKYDIQDYDHIDPHLGAIKNDSGHPLYFEKFNNSHATKYTERVTDEENLSLSDALFVKLVKEAHSMGIKIILDGVFNHCGAFNKWMDREGFYERAGSPAGAYKSEKSPYRDFFKWGSAVWPNNEDYDAWWGHKNHPKLNFEGSPELYEYILEIAKKWVSPPFNCDGWRLDVAADLGYSKAFNISFWREFRKVVKKANPAAIIIAEHYGSPSDWLTGKEWDTVMSYDAFMEPLTWFLTGMQKHSEDYRPDMLNNIEHFAGAMTYHQALFPRGALLTAMNQLSNHDHSRFLTRTNHEAGRLHTRGRKTADMGLDKRTMYLAVLVQMTWPGAPCIYYGDEAGLTGWTDPDNRRPYPWGKEDMELLDFHKAVISVRNENLAVRTGSLIYLLKSHGVLCYARVQGTEALITAINNNHHDEYLKIPVWKLDAVNKVYNILLNTDGTDFRRDNKAKVSENGFLDIKLPAKSGAIIA